jgi:arylsulfatase A-like enzyme
MKRREFLKSAGIGAAVFCLSGCLESTKKITSRGRRPNFVIIFTDDQGYADVGVYGAKGFETPNLDRMAEEGVRFTDFYVASSVCSPSRAALLTGCYPMRVGLPNVLMPSSNIGLSDEEQTIAELLKEEGYTTACYGKWHLGHHKKFLPMRHGFDDYFGLPYSNDMWPPTNSAKYPPLPLIDKQEVIQLNPDQSNLTTWYTERAVKFIEKNRGRPFFLYVPHSMPHVPLFVSDKFKGKSEQGLYGDVIMEIDWSVGRILSTLKRLGIDNNTMVIFTSDNGPWLRYGDHAGSALPLREGKNTSFDGGHREACIMRWPGQIPAGSVCREMALSMDILPTIANLAGAKQPERKIDGKDIWPLIMAEKDAKSPHEAFFYYRREVLEAVRSGRWKLHFPHDYRTVAEAGKGGKAGKVEKRRTGLELYDLSNDIGERTDVSAEYPHVVQRLTAMAERIRKELGDSAANITGDGVRAPGRI